MLATWRIAPALAAGNAVVAQAAGVGAAHRLAARRHHARGRAARRRVQRRAGDRRGGRRRAHRATPASTASRSPARSPTGKLVAQAAAANLTPASLELGGKSPFVAFADADLDAVVEAGREPVRQRGAGLPGGHAAARRGARSTTRSSNGSSRRPPRSRQGDPREEATDIGPQITREHFERVDGFVQRAKADGARGRSSAAARTRTSAACTTGPRCSATRPAGAEILTQEVFGPSSRSRRSTTRTRRSRSRTTPTTAWPRSCTRATASAPSASRERLVAGTVWVNCFFVRDLRGAVRRLAQLRDRPRGRRLELRLLRGREERLHGTVDHLRRETDMGEIVGAALVAHVPTIMLPEETRLEINDGKEITLVPGLHRIEVRGPRPAAARHRDRVRHALGVDVRAHRDARTSAGRASSRATSCRAA